MPKFNVGEEFQLKTGEEKRKIKIIFVPPIDNYGVQSYLCETYLNVNGREKPVVSLKKEIDIEKKFVPLNER